MGLFHTGLFLGFGSYNAYAFPYQLYIYIDMRFDMCQIPHMQLSMPRKKKFTEKMVAAFVPGTFEEIEDVIADHEDRTDFVREAVRREIARRASGKKDGDGQK